MRETFDRYIFRFLAAIVILVLVVGTVFYHIVEGLSWLDAYYFSVITLTTVGYGDITPQTDLGKLFTTVYIFFGVGILTTFITYNFHRTALAIKERREKRSQKKNKQP